jgi:hypothetical protein
VSGSKVGGALPRPRQVPSSARTEQSLPRGSRCCLPEIRKPAFAGLSDGQYWARTSDPQLVETVETFAPVRACSVIAANRRFCFRAVRRNRTRANTEWSHWSHGFSTLYFPKPLSRSFVKARPRPSFVRVAGRVASRNRASGASPGRSLSHARNGRRGQLTSATVDASDALTRSPRLSLRRGD